MEMKDIKPIPKYILEKIKKLDRENHPTYYAYKRFYSYLAIWKKELIKVTVAVKEHNGVWYHKQVAVHGLRSDICFVKDLEHINLAGYVVGWKDLGLYDSPKWFECGKWCIAPDSKYDPPFSPIINKDLLDRFPEYKHSCYNLYRGTDILQFLRLYEKYPQIEYMLKSGFGYFSVKVPILRQLKKDKSFHKWLVAHKDYILKNDCSPETVLTAYTKHKPLEEIHNFVTRRSSLVRQYYYKYIKRYVLELGYKRFFDYLDKNNITASCYYDYISACQYIGVNLSLPKNFIPHNFAYWHKLRIDQRAKMKYIEEEKMKRENARQAALLEKEKRQLIKKFHKVAEKYFPLAACSPNEHYLVFIAQSPAELIREGEYLDHCVGKQDYDLRMAREKSLIFFVRKLEEPDTPFVTIEYSLKTNEVLQCYGYDDSKPEEKVLNFVHKEWLPKANRALQQLAA